MRTGFSLCGISNREKPVFITGIPANENRIFPVWKNYTCRETPVLVLYWPCKGLQCTISTFKKEQFLQNYMYEEIRYTERNVNDALFLCMLPRHMCTAACVGFQNCQPGQPIIRNFSDGSVSVIIFNCQILGQPDSKFKKSMEAKTIRVVEFLSEGYKIRKIFA